MRLLLLIGFCFLSTTLAAEDSLVFCKRSNNLKEYKVALNKFPFKVVSSGGTKFSAMIVGVKDSVIVFHVLKQTGETRFLIKEQKNRLFEYRFKKGLSHRQLDSLTADVQKEIYRIKYSDERVINISSIKKLKHSNYDNPKKARVLDGVGVSGLLLGIACLSASGVINSAVPAVAGFGILVADIVYAIIAGTKRLNLKKTWKIKRVIRT